MKVLKQKGERSLKLYFENCYGEMKLVSAAASPEIAGQLIHKYISAINPNYKIYYTRYWDNDNNNGKLHRTYDVGSHTEFFHLIDEGEE